MNKPKDLILDHYHCTLFLPLIGLEKSDLKPNLEKHSYKKFTQEEGASYYYFSPTIRNILYDRETEGKTKHVPIREWRLPDSTIEDWELLLDNSKASEWSAVKGNQNTKITSVRLLQYFNGLYLLAIRLEPTALLEIKRINKPIEIEKEKITDRNKKITNTSKHEKLPQTTFEKIKINTLEEFRKLDPENISQYAQLIMEDWMHFTRLIRVIYPSFSQQSDENKIAPIYFTHKNSEGKNETISAFKDKIEKNDISSFEKIGDNFSPIISEILSNFFDTNKKDRVTNSLKNHIEFYDDRMFVSVAYGIAGEQLPESDLKRINTLVSYVDRQAADGWEKELQGYAYTPQVIQKKINQQSYALWQGLGGYYTFTDFSNSYLNRGGDFRDFIATEHIPHIYDRMLIQALFYQATLRHYDNIICDSTNQILDEKTDIDILQIKKQRGDFIKFTNQYWFHKLTEQMQGKEIFELQQIGLGVQKHYDILKDELERTDEYLQVEHERKVQEHEKRQEELAKAQEKKSTDFNNKISFYGFMIGALALYYTILPILHSALSTKTQTLWQKIGSSTCVNFQDQKAAGLTLVLVIFPLLFIGFVYMYRGIKNRNKS